MASPFEHISLMKRVEKKYMFELIQNLLIYFKYEHSPNIDYLHLINIRYESEPHEFLDSSRWQLLNSIGDIFKNFAEIKQPELVVPQPSPFTPIEVCNCARCESKFTVAINQYRYCAPGFRQFRKDISGHRRFSDHPSIAHLHIIDYSRKAYRFFPSYLISPYQHFTCKNLLINFKQHIERYHARQLPNALPKIMTVFKLFNLEDNSPTVQDSYSKLVDMIREKHYDEPLLLLEVWKSLLMSDQLIIGAFEKLTAHFPSQSKEKLKWVLVMASYLKFDLQGAWMRGHKLKNFSNCPVTSAMLSGDYEQMKTLLDYGFMPISMPLVRYNIYIRFLNRTNRFTLDFFPLGINFVVREILMFLIIRQTHSNAPSKLAKMDKCFLLLWSFLPHPLITKRQLMEENEAIDSELPKVPYLQNIKRDLDQLVEYYGDIELDVGDDVAPRKLHHLCKCRIRRCLTKAGNLPHGAKQLPVSRVLQDYLLVPDESVFTRS